MKKIIGTMAAVTALYVVYKTGEIVGIIETNLELVELTKNLKEESKKGKEENGLY